MEVIEKTINLFKPKRFCGIPVATRRSDEWIEWEEETKAFNTAVLRLAKYNKKIAKSINWSAMAICMALSYGDISRAVEQYWGSARARVVDMWETFGRDIYNSFRKR
jgi:hypothetical protein